MAEREGFEPPVRLPVRRISSAVLSTTQPPLRGGGRAGRRYVAKRWPRNKGGRGSGRGRRHHDQTCSGRPRVCRHPFPAARGRERPRDVARRDKPDDDVKRGLPHSQRTRRFEGNRRAPGLGELRESRRTPELHPRPRLAHSGRLLRRKGRDLCHYAVLDVQRLPSPSTCTKAPSFHLQ